MSVSEEAKRATLKAVQQVGPASISVIAKKSPMSRSVTRNAMYELEDEGAVARVKSTGSGSPDIWALTGKERSQPVAKESARITDHPIFQWGLNKNT